MPDRSLDEFEERLQTTLNHLYDPLFEPDPVVYTLLKAPSSSGIDGVRQAIVSWIQTMQPRGDTPPGAYTRRFYEILTYRYVSMLSQDEVAFKMGMTSRNLRRYQQQAVHTLAKAIWEASSEDVSVLLAGPGDTHHKQADVPPVVIELDLLQKRNPGAVADVGKSLKRVQAITTRLPEAPLLSIETDCPGTRLAAMIHPSVLDQLLLSTIENLFKDLHSEKIHISAVSNGNQVEIIMLARVSNEFAQPGEHPLDQQMFRIASPISEILALTGVTYAVRYDIRHVYIQYDIAAVPTVQILLVDDNPDFSYLFQRYTRDSRYQVHYLRGGERLFEVIDETSPHIIVLDVLLPDVNGWQLLIDLQRPIHGRRLPVVVCSALGQKELAYSLGANAYLPKPVTRDQLLAVLDELVQKV